MNKIILCGSKKYKNINFDQLVDSFDVVVRHNWLSDTHGYGKKPADIQVLNGHMYDHWVIKNFNLDRIKKRYASYGQNSDTIIPYKEYITNCKEAQKYFSKSRRVLKKLNIFGGFGAGPRCGICSVLKYVEMGHKPFLIGYSLSLEEFSRHATNSTHNIKSGSSYHRIQDEIVLLKELHFRGLIDASFCTIRDTVSLELDTGILTPTKESINILSKIYNIEENE